MQLDIETQDIDRPSGVVIWRVMMAHLASYQQVPYLIRNRSPIAQLTKRAAWSACVLAARFEAPSCASCWMRQYQDITGVDVGDAIQRVDAGQGWSLFSALSAADVAQLRIDLEVERAELRRARRAPAGAAHGRELGDDGAEISEVAR